VADRHRRKGVMRGEARDPRTSWPGSVLGDGGYLLELEKRGYVQAGPFTPEVVIEHPDALAQLHPRVPAWRRRRAPDDDVLRQRRQARDRRHAGKVDDINRNAVQVARQVAAEGDALVAGTSPSRGPTIRRPRERRPCPGLFDRQLQDQTDAGGVDFWIGETFSFVGEALLFVERAKRTDLPVMATMCFEQPQPRSYEGDSPADCARSSSTRGRISSG
jgi:betaine-homocysteine S-methyltransferase